jgi:hypothetical protein
LAPNSENKQDVQLNHGEEAVDGSEKDDSYHGEDTQMKNKVDFVQKREDKNSDEKDPENNPHLQQEQYASHDSGTQK